MMMMMLNKQKDNSDEKPSPSGENVIVELENLNLWKKFHQHSTEMIVTKGGRRMFPTLRYVVSGLDPNGTYAVFLQLIATSEWRYKFSSGRWAVAGRADPAAFQATSSQMYTHPDSPASGRIWMKQSISFHRLKLTNNPLGNQGHILLQSMHHYIPVISIVRLHEFYPHPSNGASQLVARCSFPETQFYAVTAYQNEKVIQLKIDHNPFAKGFRESGNAKRATTVDDDSEMKRSKIPTDKSECDFTHSPVAAVETEEKLKSTQKPTEEKIPTPPPLVAPTPLMLSVPALNLQAQSALWSASAYGGGILTTPGLLAPQLMVLPPPPPTVSTQPVTAWQPSPSTLGLMSSSPYAFNRLVFPLSL
ncbi:T-box transcription factor TBX2-B [Trichinella pseudospiralis]|uniref:T-box transcription factor TBX2-B n=1 Tax=Trichinella pseudospiralis TaxID=6337 RepID=A0A0V1IWE8_TRIPS|nr:T-box transcription factor TBX2-B [Trichinella pseudospiralis]KRY79491.1 T-box transcription factor TBX2-B [Trichinella pseudospiralis]KRZ27088.1 T-box transcription factor TBX2-B [Trichinella pseudospiralis]